MQVYKVEEQELTHRRPNAGLPRSVEIVIAFACLIAFIPVLLPFVLAILWAEGTPVLFRQKRVGYRGRLFDFYKLRTMRAGSVGALVTAEGDTRVTTIGRILRRTKLDEVPSMWNVIKGDMALVGPRPEVPRYVDFNNPDWKVILQVRPGITDPVTADLHDEERFLANVRTDHESFYREVLQPYKLRGYLKYLLKRNCWTDLMVLTQTCAIVLFPRLHTSVARRHFPVQEIEQDATR